MECSGDGFDAWCHVVLIAFDVRPIDDIARLSLVLSDQEAIFPAASIQKQSLHKRIIVRANGCVASAVKEIRPCHENRVLPPFGRPSWIFEKMFMGQAAG